MCTNKLTYSLFLAAMVVMLTSCYQMRVEVQQIPSNTPENADIYIAGEFNNWDPGDDRFILEQQGDSLYYIDLPRGIGMMEYKFTRGDWTSVEKDKCGYEIENRMLEYSSEKKVAVNSISSWADLEPVDCDKLTMVITSLPGNTPPGTVIQLIGNFTDWDTPGDDFIFMRDEESGHYILDLYRPENTEEIEFKVTRGSLGRSEGDGLGREIRPRRLRYGEADTLFMEVKSWHDLEKARKNMITLLVEDIPGNTPPDESIFFVGEINDWYPHDGSLRLEKNRLGQYFINLPKSAYNKEYKFTRGSWGTVETDRFGYEINNRSLVKEKSSDTVRVSIGNWKDLSVEIPGRISIRVIRIPDNTPSDDDIYIAGNFNDWNPGSSFWKLEKDSLGQYSINIPRDGNLLEFKFTRGSWNTVEVDALGEDIPNRVYRYGDIDALELEVAAWADL
jgi:hypothetical protein